MIVVVGEGQEYLCFPATSLSALGAILFAIFMDISFDAFGVAAGGPDERAQIVGEAPALCG